MKNKAKIISIISVVLILIIGIAGYFMYQKAEEEKAIKKSLNKITKTETSFSKVETHEEKLNILKSCITEMTDYNKSKENFKQVTDINPPFPLCKKFLQKNMILSLKKIL